MNKKIINNKIKRKFRTNKCLFVQYKIEYFKYNQLYSNCRAFLELLFFTVNCAESFFELKVLQDHRFTSFHAEYTKNVLKFLCNCFLTH